MFWLSFGVNNIKLIHVLHMLLAMTVSVSSFQIVPRFNRNSLLWILSLTVALGFDFASGVQLDSRCQFDLIDGLRVYNNNYVGLSVVEGIHRFSPAVFLQGETRHLQVPFEMYFKISQLLSQTNDFTFLATLKQEEKNIGTIISFSEGNERFLELQSSGRKDEIRLHYTHKNNLFVETFPWHLADNNWHQIALTVSGSSVQLYIDCNQIYKRIIYDVDQDFASRNLSLWLGQRNTKHYLFKGFLQDVHVIGDAHGYVKQCPHLDIGCPTCGQFRQLQTSVLQLESHIKELTERLAFAEKHISELKECECQKSCEVSTSVYPDGSTWKSGCDICACVHGEIRCRPVTCSTTVCKNPIHVPGECCPVCLKKCLLENVSYEHGERVSPIQCVTCECKNGSMHCRRIDPDVSCPQLTCPESEQFNVPGECCRFCPGVDYCSQGHDCHYNSSCLNLKTQYTCQCIRGFTGDGRHCEDINECLSEGGYDGHHCQLHTKCVNLPGDYVCQCLNGYKRVDAYNCIEHDECKASEHNCHENAVCVNTAGSYTCKCSDGYSGDGFTCDPICSIPCENGGECTAPETCSCRHGYLGPACEIDVDECNLGLHVCHPNSQCINMPGWYYCKCRSGYESHPEDDLGAFCQDIDECLTGSHTCHMTASCVNEDGTYYCECADNSSCSLSCLYYGEERLNGEIWSTDVCTECHCTNGVVACQPAECDCSKPDKNIECCPHCDHLSTCQHQETHISFRSGDQWIYQCQICECLYGDIDCWEMDCPPLTCETPFRSPGDCCPRCENDPCNVIYNNSYSQPVGCLYDGRIYQTGEKMPLMQNTCSSCQCQDGQWCCTFSPACSNNHTVSVESSVQGNITEHSDKAVSNNKNYFNRKKYSSQSSRNYNSIFQSSSQIERMHLETFMQRESMQQPNLANTTSYVRKQASVRNSLELNQVRYFKRAVKSKKYYRLGTLKPTNEHESEM